MSADNTVVILNYKDGYKVQEVQAAEDLFTYGDDLDLINVVNKFGNCKFTKDKGLAINIADRICNNHFVEYGMKFAHCDMYWNQLLETAYQEAEDKLKNEFVSDYQKTWYQNVIDIRNKYQSDKAERALNKTTDKGTSKNKVMTVKELYNELGKIVKEGCGSQPVFIEAFDNKEGNYIFSPTYVSGGGTGAGTTIS